MIITCPSPKDNTPFQDEPLLLLPEMLAHAKSPFLFLGLSRSCQKEVPGLGMKLSWGTSPELCSEITMEMKGLEEKPRSCLPQLSPSCRPSPPELCRIEVSPAQPALNSLGVQSGTLIHGTKLIQNKLPTKC